MHDVELGIRLRELYMGRDGNGLRIVSAGVCNLVSGIALDSAQEPTS